MQREFELLHCLDHQCLEDIVWNYLALLPEDWSLLICMVWTWSSQVTDPNSVLKYSSQGCPAIPWSRPDHVLPRHYSCATNMGEFLGSVYHWQSSSSLLWPRKSVNGKKGGEKNSWSKQRSNTQVKIRYNMVWRHSSPIFLYFRREEAEFSKVNFENSYLPFECHPSVHVFRRNRTAALICSGRHWRRAHETPFLNNCSRQCLKTLALYLSATPPMRFERHKRDWCDIEYRQIHAASASHNVCSVCNDKLIILTWRNCHEIWWEGAKKHFDFYILLSWTTVRCEKGALQQVFCALPLCGGR